MLALMVSAQESQQLLIFLSKTLSIVLRRAITILIIEETTSFPLCRSRAGKIPSAPGASSGLNESETQLIVLGLKIVPIPFWRN